MLANMNNTFWAAEEHLILSWPEMRISMPTNWGNQQ